MLARIEYFSGRLNQFELHDPAAVRRVVYVCLGNICRSAYGHQVARSMGLRVASLGLSTTTGVGCPQQAVAAARRQGSAMEEHRAVDWSDFVVQPGDLFLVMEVRQAHELRHRLGSRTDVQVCLLGQFSTPSVPHLHDPFSLGDPYFDTCFERVGAATAGLRDVLHAAGAPASAG